jgi:hypothetical protein
MQERQNQFVADLVSLLDADLREQFEERVAVMEFDAGLGREHADAWRCLAFCIAIRPY